MAEIQLLPGEKIIQESEIKVGYMLAVAFFFLLIILGITSEFNWWWLIPFAGGIHLFLKFFDKIILTTHRVIRKSGAKTAEINLTEVEEVVCGDMEFKITGLGDNEIKIDFIKDPEGWKHKILEAAAKAK